MKTKHFSWMVAVVIVLACMAAQAQSKDTDEQQSSGKAKTVTGCLAKGDSPNEFYLTSDDGKKYELRSDQVSLADHVGHKITVTGTSERESAAEEKREGEQEKNEAAENQGMQLRVTNVKMISDSCQK